MSFKKEVIEITEEILINPSDISALEQEQDRYNYWKSKISSFGTIITMKSGRKIFAAGLTPKEVLQKIESQTPAIRGRRNE